MSRFTDVSSIHSKVTYVHEQLLDWPFKKDLQP